jgi:hypothetical protein
LQGYPENLIPIPDIILGNKKSQGLKIIKRVTEHREVLAARNWRYLSPSVRIGSTDLEERKRLVAALSLVTENSTKDCAVPTKFFKS